MTEKLILHSMSEWEFKELLTTVLQKLIKENQVESGISKNERSSWITRVEASKHLRISLPTLDKRTKEGKLNVYRTGRKKVYNLKELNDAIGKNIIRFK